MHFKVFELFICEEAKQNKWEMESGSFQRAERKSREQTEIALSGHFSLLANWKGKINKICAKIGFNYFL